MGIFSSIKDAIFGKKAHADEGTDLRGGGLSGSAARPTGGLSGVSAGTAAGGLSGSQQVDVEAVLEDKNKRAGQDLNWRNSIVDLMKLLGIDSSYENRKDLAQDLGRTDYSGSAEDNIWLHKATMRELEKHGGRVPASLRD